MSSTNLTFGLLRNDTRYSRMYLSPLVETLEWD